MQAGKSRGKKTPTKEAGGSAGGQEVWTLVCAHIIHRPVPARSGNEATKHTRPEGARGCPRSCNDLEYVHAGNIGLSSLPAMFSAQTYGEQRRLPRSSNNIVYVHRAQQSVAVALTNV